MTVTYIFKNVIQYARTSTKFRSFNDCNCSKLKIKLFAEFCIVERFIYINGATKKLTNDSMSCLFSWKFHSLFRVWEIIIIIGVLLETPFHWRPPDSRWRPQYFHWRPIFLLERIYSRPHIFIGDPKFSLEIRWKSGVLPWKYLGLWG